MPDISHQIGGDLDLSSTGGLLIVDGDNLSQQRVIKRLFTNPGAYIWHPEYGAGLGQYVGNPASPMLIKARILAQMLMEPSVDQTVPPLVTVKMNDDNTFYCTIQYATASSQSTVLGFSVSSAGSYVQGNIYNNA